MNNNTHVHNASRQHIDLYTVRLHGAPCSSLDGVTACVVYTADSIRDSIRTQKNDSQVPNIDRNKNRHHRCIFHHYGGTLPYEPWNPNFACVVGFTT